MPRTSDSIPQITALRLPPAPLNRLDRLSLAILAAAFVLVSGLTLSRSALLPRRYGDWNVFARAAWAARSGEDLYDITDDNGFHYLYPPTFAVLLAPLADAPPGAPRDGLLPYPLTVHYWYFFNLACLGLSVHWLASAVEQASPTWSNPAWLGSRGWWGLRLWPMMACLPTVGHTLIRGQVGLLLLLFLSGMISALVRGRNGRAGGWLACAICLKVIPALLLVYPLIRRDMRFLAGCALGLLAGLIAIPLAVRGPEQTWRDYQKWNQVMVAPAVANGTDTSRAREVLDVIATDSQSFLAMIHNTTFLDRETRPRQASTRARLAALTAAAALGIAVLIAARRHRLPDATAAILGSRDAPRREQPVTGALGNPDTPRREQPVTGALGNPDTPWRDSPTAALIAWGALIEVMLLASPVCHLHYFCLSVPLMTGLLAFYWRGQTRPPLGAFMSLLIGLNIAANAVPHFPGMELWRDIGLAGYAALALVFAALYVLWLGPRTTAAASDSLGKLAA